MIILPFGSLASKFMSIFVKHAIDSLPEKSGPNDSHFHNG